MILALTFASPALLWLLLLIPLAIVAYVLVQRQRPKYAVRFTNLELLSTVVPKQPGWRRHVPAAAVLGALGILLLAIARPMATTAVPTQQATVMLTIDVSGSMIATDVSPTRLAAAQRSAEAFVAKAPKNVKIGVVAFSSQARLLAPPTTDRAVVRRALESLSANGGTAMGDAIETALAAAVGPSSDGSAAPSTTTTTAPSTSSTTTPGATTTPTTAPAVKPVTMVVLLSDGKATLGVDPMTAADEAKQAGVVIDTVALGTADGVADIRDGSGEIQRIPVPPDPETLKAVADRTGGKAFTAPSAKQLRSIYSTLGSKVGKEVRTHEVTTWFAGLAVVVLLVGAGLGLAWHTRFP